MKKKLVYSFAEGDGQDKQLLHPALDPVSTDEPVVMSNESGILQDNPFEVLDVQGLGQLINMAVYNGHRVRSDLKIDI